MAAVVIIPPRHITLRAMWWLAKCEQAFGGIQYPVPMDVAACAYIMPCINKRTQQVDWAMVESLAKKPTTMEYLQYGPGKADIPFPKRSNVPKLWQCSVADMRAIAMGMTIAIDARATHSPGKHYVEPGHKAPYTWCVREVVTPTCSTCGVLMDMMLQNPAIKRGQYPTEVDSRDGSLAKWKDAP